MDDRREVDEALREGFGANQQPRMDGDWDRFLYWYLKRGNEVLPTPDSSGPMCSTGYRAQIHESWQGDTAYRQWPIAFNDPAWIPTARPDRDTAKLAGQLPMLDALAGPDQLELADLLDAQLRDMETDALGIVPPEHWRLVRSADAGDDSGTHIDNGAGMPPAQPQSCLHRLAERVTASRVASKASTERKMRLRATFCIREIVEQHIRQGAPKRKGRPSKGEMQRRAALFQR